MASPDSRKLASSCMASLASFGLWLTPAQTKAAQSCDHEGPRSDRAALEAALDEIIAQRELTPVPPAPKVRPALRELGQRLNFDPILSGNQNISCAACHHPSTHTSDARHLPLGTGAQGLGLLREGGGIAPRNSPALFNLHAYQSMFWDNRIDQWDDAIFTPGDEDLSPEIRATWEFGIVSAQAMFPVTSHVEMRGQPGENPIADARNNREVWARLTQRVLAVPEYKTRLEQAYPGQDNFNFGHIANALAAFEIDAFSQHQSPWQRYLEGEHQALSDRQIQGALGFFDSGCADCHSGSLFSDFQLHNVGLAPVGPGKGMGESGMEDWGRMNVTAEPRDKFLFRTAPLINVELTGPYGHAGQFNTLRDYVAHYQDLERSFDHYDTSHHVHAYEPLLWYLLPPMSPEISQTVSPLAKAIKPFEVDQILDFLSALTDPAARSLGRVIPDSVPSGLAVNP